MKGSECRLIEYMEGAKKRFIIPVYQRNYDWKTEYGTYFSSKGEFIPKDENVELPENYISSVKSIVRNKMRFCEGVLTHDYFRHLFG